MSNQLLTTVQAARELGISRYRVHQLVSSQPPLLPARKVGDRWLITRTALDAYKQRKRPRGRPRKDTTDGQAGRHSGADRQEHNGHATDERG